MDEILSEELTSNVEENDINEPELEHTYLESETLNEHEESANNSCSSSDDERPEYEGMGPLDYNPSILMLAREWILTHLGRNCSNSVADDFFQFALDHAQVFFTVQRGIERQTQRHDGPEKKGDEGEPSADKEGLYFQRQVT